MSLDAASLGACATVEDAPILLRGRALSAIAASHGQIPVRSFSRSEPIRGTSEPSAKFGSGRIE